MTHTTQGASAGRARWGCSKQGDDKCMLFVWVTDAPSNPPPSSRMVPAKRPHSTATNDTYTPSSSVEDDPPPRQCPNCGKVGVTKTVTKESGNKGRVFWKCVDAQVGSTGPCAEWFEWNDEPPRNAGSGGGGSMGSRTASTSGAGGSGSCFEVCY